MRIFWANQKITPWYWLLVSISVYW